MSSDSDKLRILANRVAIICEQINSGQYGYQDSIRKDLLEALKETGLVNNNSDNH